MKEHAGLQQQQEEEEDENNSDDDGSGNAPKKKSNGRRPNGVMPKRRLGSRQMMMAMMRGRLGVSKRTNAFVNTGDCFDDSTTPESRTKPKLRIEIETTPDTLASRAPTSVSSSTSTTSSSFSEHSHTKDEPKQDVTEEISLPSYRANVEGLDVHALNQEFRHFLEHGQFPDAHPNDQPHVAILNVTPHVARRLHFGATADDDDPDADHQYLDIDNDVSDGVGNIVRIARAASALDSAGNELFERGEYRRAMATYERSLRLKKRTLLAAAAASSERPSSSSSALSPPNSLSPIRAPPNLPEVGTHVAGLDHSQRDAMLASVATSINNIGYIRQRSGSATAAETMAAYQDALRIKQNILGSDSLSVAKTMNNIGSVYFSVGEFEPALSTYTEAHRIMTHNLGDDHLDVATLHSNIGDVHLARSQYDTALVRYREALRIRWTQLEESDPKVIRLLEKIASTMHSIERRKGHGASDDDDDGEDGAYSDDETGKVQPISVRKECEELKTQVKADLTWINNIGRELALDMVKEKLNMIRDLSEAMNQQQNAESPPEPEPEDDSLNTTFFSDLDDLPGPSLDRHSDAVRNVKERLAKLRERKRIRMQEEGMTALRALSGFSTNDTTSADSNNQEIDNGK